MLTGGAGMMGVFVPANVFGDRRYEAGRSRSDDDGGGIAGVPGRYGRSNCFGGVRWAESALGPRDRTPKTVGRVCTYIYEQKRGNPMGSVIKKRRKRMSKKKHRKMLRRTRVQRRKLGK